MSDAAVSAAMPAAAAAVSTAMPAAAADRDEALGRLEQPLDLLVVGGGITGAGVLREAARLGLKAALVEAHDVASGTSSRSSKLVHGGLRYLREGRLHLVLESVSERNRLLREAPGLVDPLGFLIARYPRDPVPGIALHAGLGVFDVLALQWKHRALSREDLLVLAPHLLTESLKGGFAYEDAQTDDTRLVLRVLTEAAAAGAVVLPRVRAVDLLRTERGVAGAAVRDELTGRTFEVRARAVVNATGAWADTLRGRLGKPPRMRPLRGSHLILPAWRLPLFQALWLFHPRDGRPVFAIPWDGVTIFGTTDADHKEDLETSPAITPAEVAYLLEGLQNRLPGLGLRDSDVLAAFAGVRPVVSSGKADPTKESREHAVWDEDGLLTVTGGKLTTFRRMAWSALHALRARLALDEVSRGMSIFDSPGEPLDHPELPPWQRRRLQGWYGARAKELVGTARAGELAAVPGTSLLWAEVRWAARNEWVVHLADLLLRRVRVGLLLPRGAADILPRVRTIAREELGWDEERWGTEEALYLETWRRQHRVPLSQ